MNPDETVIAQRNQDTEKEMYDILNVIFKKPVEAMTYQDRAFLKARQDYLTSAQREQYAEVLTQELPAPLYKKK